MCELNSANFTSKQIKLIRKYLKLRITEDNVTFRGHEQEWNHVYDLMKRTVLQGESHSALLIGPRGSGKTTLVNSVLHRLGKEADLASDAIIVKLNGHLHHDDKVALKSITAQMQLENSVGDRVFGTFAENLSFLLSCLKSADSHSKSMIFLLEEFHAFCHSARTQTLLYNLFDITHARQAPMCVLGITNRLDVMETLEKRVKSRFSHRHIFIFPGEGSNPHARLLDELVELLSVPLEKAEKVKKRARKKSVAAEPMDTDSQSNSIPIEILNRCKVDPKEFSNLDPGFVEDWNAHVLALRGEERVVDAFEKLCYYTNNEQIFKDILFQIVCTLSPSKPFIEALDIISTIDRTVAPEHKVKLLQSLSILELSLVIAMKHGMDIFDGQPMNFEMVLHRYTKFAASNSSTQTVPRPVILKAFEHLQALELLVPVRSSDYASNETTASRVQKEYQLFTLSAEGLNEAVAGFKALPTEISHWLNSGDL
ncbi:origin recognition complex subunit 4 isoform X1 [Cydia pomonella]|uniref:origin recognition complex subunit 4 isoform X1 n=1 Tax=Cydia pomonella TaxID=82600 RepID=UPI002ADE5108|nr:origin recognition complex subunit 4 isoform X1 [Cydia pomonella]XP_061726618.1 origin recognition complex subunit 4 isoform X1 [Cydia pomonella]